MNILILGRGKTGALVAQVARERGHEVAVLCAADNPRASALTGFVMRRIKYYRYLGTLGTAVMILGMWLLSQVTPSTAEWNVVADLIVIGL